MACSVCDYPWTPAPCGLGGPVDIATWAEEVHAGCLEFERTRNVRRAVVAVITATLVALPTTAWAEASVVSITVPPTQRLEEATALTLTATSRIHRGFLVVRSNIPWTLLARVSNSAVQVAWKDSAAAAWRPLGAITPMLRGPKGVYKLEYALRVSASNSVGAISTVVISFCIVPRNEEPVPDCDRTTP